MKKSIVAISSVLQFVASILYLIILLTIIKWGELESPIGYLAIFIIVAIGVQFLSIKLRNKHPEEFYKASSIVTESKPIYSWIGLGFLGLILLALIVGLILTLINP